MPHSPPGFDNDTEELRNEAGGRSGVVGLFILKCSSGAGFCGDVAADHRTLPRFLPWKFSAMIRKIRDITLFSRKGIVSLEFLAKLFDGQLLR